MKAMAVWIILFALSYIEMFLLFYVYRFELGVESAWNIFKNGIFIYSLSGLLSASIGIIIIIAALIRRPDHPSNWIEYTAAISISTLVTWLIFGGIYFLARSG